MCGKFRGNPGMKKDAAVVVGRCSVHFWTFAPPLRLYHPSKCFPRPSDLISTSSAFMSLRSSVYYMCVCCLISWTAKVHFRLSRSVLYVSHVPILYILFPACHSYICLMSICCSLFFQILSMLAFIKGFKSIQTPVSYTHLATNYAKYH